MRLKVLGLLALFLLAVSAQPMEREVISPPEPGVCVITVSTTSWVDFPYRTDHQNAITYWPDDIERITEYIEIWMRWCKDGDKG